MRYKNIIFDVGGVLIGYRWMEMLNDYGLSQEEANAFARDIFPHPIWSQFDLDNVSHDTVIETYVAAFPHYEAPIRWFFGHPELMPVGRPQIWEQVHALKQAGYKTYLLSNYSRYLFSMHTDGMPFRDDMDGGVISYQIHAIKPDPAIYHELFDRYSLTPCECLFLDDRQVNIDGGNACGMDGIVIENIQQLSQVLSALLKEAQR